MMLDTFLLFIVAILLLKFMSSYTIGTIVINFVSEELVCVLHENEKSSGY